MGPFFVKGMRNRPGGRREQLLRERDINSFVQPLSPAVRWYVEGESWCVLGFKVFDGRGAYFGLDSADLPAVVDLVQQAGELKLPEIARGWPETRWDRFLSEDDAALLRGDALLHTDINPSNCMIGESETRLVDWSWPTRGAGFMDPATLVFQLVSAHHDPAVAEWWVERCPAWTAADPEGIDAFVRASVHMQRWLVERRPDESWLKAMVTAAESWAEHRGVTV
jgi:hypothetical protein